MLELKLDLLQMPRIWAEGVEISFPLRRADALLYYMVCEKTATREELVALLWEQCSAESGRKNLRNVLYVLKKGLGMDLLVSVQKNKLSLNPELSIDCDYLKFMEQGEFTLLRGPFLSGFSIKDSNAFDQWVEQTRERVRKQYLACLSRLAESTAQTGAMGRAERCASDYLRANPADEAMACFLMGLYRSQHKYAEAARVYQQLHDYLERELGIPPMNDTTRLHYELLKEWNLSADSQDRLAPAKSHLPLSRQALLGRLSGELHRFSAGRREGGALLLLGEAGAGKSFLLSRALEGLEPGIAVLRASCLPSEAALPMRPWLSLLAALRRATDACGLTPPQWAARHADGLLAGQPASLDVKQTEEAVLLLLHLLLGQSKILLCFEDVQWMDSSSLGLLDRVMRRCLHLPLLCLMTGRERLPPTLAAVVDRAVEDRIAHLLTLPPFSQAEVREMLQVAFDSGAANRTYRTVWEATGGNPGLICRLMEKVSEESEVCGALLEHSGLLREERLQALAPQSRRLLAAMSCCPSGIAKELTPRLLGLPAEEMEPFWGELLDSRFAAERPGEDGALLTIDEEALRLWLYERQPLAVRRRNHQAVAGLLQGLPQTGQTLEQTALHLERCGDWAGALESRGKKYALLLREICGMDAHSASSLLIRELPQLGRCLDGLAPDEGCGGRQWLLLADGVAALASRRGADAARRLAGLLTSAPQADLALLPLALELVCRFAWAGGCGEQLADALKGQMDAPQPAAGPFALLYGRVCLLYGRLAEGEKALGPLLESPSGYLRALACRALGEGLGRQGKEDAASWLLRGASEADALDPFWGIARFYQDAGRAAEQAGEDETARQQFETALYLASKTRDESVISVSQAYLSLCRAREGDRTGAAQLLGEAQERARSLSCFEQGVVCLAKARLGRMSGACPHDCEGPPLPCSDSVERCCRRGLLLLTPLHNADFEIEMLRGCLRA